MEEEKKEKKFKTDKYCGLRENNKCNSYCGLFNIGLGGCCLHSINMNLQELVKATKDISKK